MSTNTLYLSGKAYWAKVFEHNLDNYDGTLSAQIEIELDKEQRDALKESGSRVTPKLQDDGTIRVRFKRKFDNPLFPNLGGLPNVLDAEGKPLNELIGNGSDVTVKVTVYDTKKGKGTRLESVRVDNLVEYNAESKSNEDTTFLKGLPF